LIWIENLVKKLKQHNVLLIWSKPIYNPFINIVSVEILIIEQAWQVVIIKWVDLVGFVNPNISKLGIAIGEPF
jgi:hypothetical protein